MSRRLTRSQTANVENADVRTKTDEIDAKQSSQPSARKARPRSAATSKRALADVTPDNNAPITNTKKKPKTTIVKRSAPKEISSAKSSSSEDDSDYEDSPTKKEIPEDDETTSDDDDFVENTKPKKTTVRKKPQKQSVARASKQKSKAESQKLQLVIGSDDDWEEVDDQPSTSGIVLKRPKSKRESEKEEWIRKALRQWINRYRKDVQLDAHKLHFLCLLARVSYISRHYIADSLIQSLCLSHVPAGYVDTLMSKVDREVMGKLCAWFASAYRTDPRFCLEYGDRVTMSSLTASIGDRRPISSVENVIIFVATVRALGVPCRLVANLRPLPIKIGDVRYFTRLLYDLQSTEPSDAPPPKKSKNGGLSSKEKSSPPPPVDMWSEVYISDEWVPVSPIDGRLTDGAACVARASPRAHYIVAVDEEHSMADVLPRYLGGNALGKTTRQSRADDEFVARAMNAAQPRRRVNPLRMRIEQMQFEKLLEECPFPKTIGEFKHHPRFALVRDLLKFEAIYPADTKPLGQIRKEDIYPRSCVHQLHSSDTWLKDARSVKKDEEPYKIVQARPKMGVPKEKQEPDRPLPVYGRWQTEEYDPPTAENGYVPRNPYGNVDLFKECMLPKGCKYLTPYPRLNNVARKLNIDCAAAMVGWAVDSGRSHPDLQGWVVCNENVDKLLAAYVKAEKEREEREAKAVVENAVENWRRLTKGLLIRDKLKTKMEVPAMQRRGVEHDDVLEEEPVEQPKAWTERHKK